jgi:aspartyl protease family protein
MSRSLILAMFAGSALVLLGQQLALRPLPGFAREAVEDTAPATLFAAAEARVAPGAAPGETVLTREAGGGFHLTAGVNGHQASFVVDTGADLVSLSEDDARRLGLPVDSAQMRPMLRTADGLADAQPLRIARLTIGGQEMRDVPAVVVPGLEVNLLGESALSRLRRVVLTGNHMVIEPG